MPKRTQHPGPATIGRSITLLALLPLLIATAACAEDIAEHSMLIGQGETAQTRHFTVVRPDSYQPGGRTVVLLHGGSQSMRKVLDDERTTSRWLELAERDGFLLLVPNGYNLRRDDPEGDRQTWNDLRGGADGRRSQQNDVAFIVALLDWAEEHHEIDRSRVYVTGSSNGGMMAMRLLVEAPEHFAAAAAFIAALPAEEIPDPARGVPIMMMNGDEDPLVRWEGGPVGRGAAPSRSVEATVEYWLRANGVTTDAAQARQLPDTDPDDGCRISETRYRSADGDSAPVVFYRVAGGGHNIPDPDPPLRNAMVERLIGTQCRDLHGVDPAWEFMRQWGRGEPEVEQPEENAGPVPGPAEDVGMEVLRTPDARFDDLPGYDFEPNYVFVDDFEGGTLRMHYLDEGPADGPTLLMMHGNPTWSYMFREVIPKLNEAGYRTIVVDFIGMGRSDKPTDFDDYTYDRHVLWVADLFTQLDDALELGRVSIFGHDYGTPIGIRLMCEHFPERFDAFIDANASLPDGTFVHPIHRNWRQFVRENPDVPLGHVIAASVVDPPLSQEEIRAYYAPYPDSRYKAAIRSFPEMVPDSPDEAEAVANRAAWAFMESFSQPFMTIFGPADLVRLPSGRMTFLERIPGAYGQPHAQLDVKHYAPEDDPEGVAAEVVAFLDEVYHPRSFDQVAYEDFASDPGIFELGDGTSYDATEEAIRIAHAPGGASPGCATGAIDLSDAGALKVAFRYRPESMEAGESLLLELADGADWKTVLALEAGIDFRNGADDYGFVRLTSDAAPFVSDARIRVRCEGNDASNAVLLLDVGIYARPAGG